MSTVQLHLHRHQQHSQLHPFLSSSSTNVCFSLIISLIYNHSHLMIAFLTSVITAIPITVLSPTISHLTTNPPLYIIYFIYKMTAHFFLIDHHSHSLNISSFIYLNSSLTSMHYFGYFVYSHTPLFPYRSSQSFPKYNFCHLL